MRSAANRSLPSFEFIHRLKIKYRQLTAAFVDLSKLPQAFEGQKPKPLATTYRYDQINPLEDGSGWTLLLPRKDPDGKSRAYCLYIAEISGFIQAICQETQAAQPRLLRGDFTVDKGGQECRIAVTVTIAFNLSLQLVSLTGTLILPENQGVMSGEPFMYPRGCSEAMHLQMIVLFLCHMKFLYYKNTEPKP